MTQVEKYVKITVRNDRRNGGIAMTTTELNKYIKHYLEKDKTHTAIMLTGEWGSGKTYYVENVLAPFLQENGKNRCVVISLYGLETIEDISKSIYMELRTKALDKESEVWSAGKLIAKTVAKGAAGIFGIDVSMSEDDLQKLYSSIDLSGKLLVFEDLERNGIELVKLLGYVNNLVERDGIKILLVANENEILQKVPETFNFNFTMLRSEQSENSGKEKKETHDLEGVHKYLKIKEKTICDTIYFESDYCEAIENIIDAFDNPRLKEIIGDDAKKIEGLASMVKGCCHKNFRTFIFATQKTVDIYEGLVGNHDKDFLECIYYGIIHFSAKIKTEEFPAWQGTEYLSTNLGTNWYPLFKFCYDYIRWQKLDTEKAGDTEEAFRKMKLYDKNAEQWDKDLQKIYNYHERTEKEVTETLESVEERLKNPDDIGFYSYNKLVVHLVTLNHIIGFDYTICKERMIENIRGKGEEIDSNILFLPFDDFVEGEKEEYYNFVNQLTESMNYKKEQNIFSYNPKDIDDLYKNVFEKERTIFERHEFISTFDINQIVEMLFHSTAKQISDFRGILFAVYRHAGKADFLETDVAAMKEMLKLIETKLDAKDYDMDKIQLKQIDWLCGNLRKFISQME